MQQIKEEKQHLMIMPIGYNLICILCKALFAYVGKLTTILFYISWLSPSHAELTSLLIVIKC
jgi:hypothetical protein